MTLIGHDSRKEGTDTFLREELPHPGQRLRGHALRAHTTAAVDVRLPQGGTSPHPWSGDPLAAVRELSREHVFGPREENRPPLCKDRTVPDGPVGENDLAPADEKGSVCAGLSHGAHYKEEISAREGGSVCGDGPQWPVEKGTTVRKVRKVGLD